MYSNEIICNVLKYIDRNINQKITIEDLSNQFYINRYYLMRLFKKEIGISIIIYINSIRIHDSLNDLKNFTILNVALKHGFYSQEYFSEIFKKIMKVNPMSYKKYINNSKNISENEIDKTINAVVNLKELIYLKEKYLANQMPKESITKFPSFFYRK